MRTMTHLQQQHIHTQKAWSGSMYFASEISISCDWKRARRRYPYPLGNGNTVAFYVYSGFILVNGDEV
jgi:hypothetical protein